ncbi:olfactory receptor 1020-like [Mastacembelus armatus]|uniref:olfactory receptor 1020-like n=1 Tax=Mastacembelus armatus TaxID=205130 RepID=UPI0014368772|nr:olfactory receptor 1020-like [Mastacembelus armatus]
MQTIPCKEVGPVPEEVKVVDKLEIVGQGDRLEPGIEAEDSTEAAGASSKRGDGTGNENRPTTVIFLCFTYIVTVVGNVFLMSQICVGALLSSQKLWIVLMSMSACTVGLLDRLSFCGSLVIQNFMCGMGTILDLACGDTSLISNIAFVSFVLNPCLPPILIILTYVCIVIALSRVASRKERLKAAKTCTSHLILVAVYFIPFLYSNLISDIDRDGMIITEVLPDILPPLINPILYSLKTEEVLNCIKKLCNNILSNITMSKKGVPCLLCTITWDWLKLPHNPG